MVAPFSAHPRARGRAPPARLDFTGRLSFIYLIRHPRLGADDDAQAVGMRVVGGDIIRRVARKSAPFWLFLRFFPPFYPTLGLHHTPMFVYCSAMEMLVARGAPRTRRTVIRLRDVLADLVGRPRARSLIEHMTRLDAAMRGERRFSAPVTPRQCAVALMAAACDAGVAAAAFSRALTIADSREHVPGVSPGPTVLHTIEAEIIAACHEGARDPDEWHFGLAATKAIDGDGGFRLFLPVAPEPRDAHRLTLPYERTDVLPASSISAVAELWL